MVKLTKPAWIAVCRHGRDFHLGQAASLKRQFERQVGSDWDFVYLTDRPSEDWHLPLRTDWPGWWAILESFHLTGQPHVLTGLDTLLYGDLRPILRLAGEWCQGHLPDRIYSAAATQSAMSENEPSTI